MAGVAGVVGAVPVLDVAVRPRARRQWCQRRAAANAAEGESAQPVLTRADVGDITGRNAMPESSLGGATACIVCFARPKTHLAAPCGHQSVDTCAERMQLCPFAACQCSCGCSTASYKWTARVDGWIYGFRDS